MLYNYPKQAHFGRVIPKNKIYEHGSVNTSTKDKFVNQIEKIVWTYKLAPETLNLESKQSVPEIQVFDIYLKTSDIDEELLKYIAAETEGKYFRATGNRKLEAIYDEINKLEKTEIEEFKYYNYQEKFRPLLMMAGFLILMEMMLRFTVYRSFI